MLKKYYISKLHKDNAGMSLVELIVAIAILSVAITPLLYTFVYTASFNAKAKVKQRATNAAMSVMETFKAYGLEESRELLEAGLVDPEKGLLSSAPAGYEKKVGGDDDSWTNESWIINGVQFSSEGKEYNVQVDYSKEKIESIEIIPFYDKKKDALFAEDYTISKYYDPYSLITYIFSKDHGFKTKDNRVKSIDINRMIYINVSSSGVVNVRYEFEGTYKIDGTSEEKVFSVNKDGNKKIMLDGSLMGISSTEIQTQINNLERSVSAEEADKLRDLYFYFYPSYSKTVGKTSACSVTSTDRFWIDNDYSDELNIYMYKQKDISYTNEELVVFENNYIPKVSNNGSSKVASLYDVINANLGNMQQKNMFTDVMGSEKVKIYNSFTTGSLPLTAKITITVIDPAPKTGVDPNLAVIEGTVSW